MKWSPEMRRVIDEFDDRVLIGEIYLPLDRLVAYYGNDLSGAQIAVQLRAVVERLGARGRSRRSSPITKLRLPCGRLAELGARQSRSAAGGEPGRAGAGARRRDAAVDPAGTRRRSTTATRSACIRSRSRPIRCAIPLRKTCRESASAATAAARRCNGTRRQMPDSQRRSRGCRLRRRLRPRKCGQSRRRIAHSILSLYKALIELRKAIAATGDPALRADRGDGRFAALSARRRRERHVVIALNLGAEPVSIASDVNRFWRRNPAFDVLDRQGERIEERWICAAMKA